MKRMIIKAALPAAAVAGMLAAAPMAHADNQSFIDTMNGAGLSSDLGVSGLMQAGKGACSLLAPSPRLMFGRHPNMVAQWVWEANPMLERNEASVLVNAAIDNLCPGSSLFGRAA